MTRERYEEIKKIHEEAFRVDAQAADHLPGFEWMLPDHTPHVDALKEKLGDEFEEYMAVACPDLYPGKEA